MSSPRTLRALVTVGVLGAGAGAGIVLGLSAALAWWVRRVPHRPADSLLPAAGYAVLGAVGGLVLGMACAGAALLAVAALRRRRRSAGNRPGQNRSS